MKHYMYRSEIQYKMRRMVKIAPTIFNKLVRRGVFTFDLISSYWKRAPYVYADADFVRNSTLELVSREIYDKGINGAVAELGVFRGDYAKLINQAFPDRKLYLFDTFEGFSKNDLEDENSLNLNTQKKKDIFSNTNIKTVNKKMKYSQNCIFKKGFFPDTWDDSIEDEFAFVSIDCDLYEPIYKGLCLFYKKLKVGGYIFVHDYQNKGYPGTRKAVNDFCKEFNTYCIPMSDTCGSAIIVKISGDETKA